MPKMNEKKFDKLMKKLYPNPEFREAVIKGAEISTSLVYHYKTKTKESEKKLNEAMESGKLFLAKIDSMKDVRYIKDKWINKPYAYIAIKCKGEWVYYKRSDEK
jgi:hypothetical protein